MRKLLLAVLATVLITGHADFLMAQPELNSWLLNTDGTTASYYQNMGNPQNPNYVLQMTNDSANVLQVCYTADTVWVRADGLTTEMGIFTNPGQPSPQDWVWTMPRNPSVATNNRPVSNVAAIGFLINGVPIFGKGDATSWDNGQQDNDFMGQGIWNVDAWYGEGFTLDTTLGAHPTQDGQYHTHATPNRLYDFPSTSHSPIIGYSFDGYPIYGPFGYSDPNDASSSVKQIMSSYQLRGITDRTSLPDGTTLMANQYGPAISTTHPLGEYNEDYEYVVNSGDLDEHNGRFCLTPDYPQGTYAYFVTADNSGSPAYPYFIGETYYGNLDSRNQSPFNNIQIPTTGVNCLSNTPTAVLELESNDLRIFPNPARSSFRVEMDQQAIEGIVIRDIQGRVVWNQDNLQVHSTEIRTDNWADGMYYVTVLSQEQQITHKLLVH